jgi:uncharacterized membrane protein
MSKPWKLVLVLLGIFIAGGVTGAFVTLRFGRDWIVKRPWPDQWAPNHMKRLVERLGLQPDQQEQLRPIIRRNMEELSRVRNESMAATRSVIERMEQEVSEKLTPEQRVKYDQLNKEMRERAKKIVPERYNRPAGPGGPPTGEPGKAPAESPPPEKPAGGV